MKILIYGFKPYKDWKENISEKIVKKVKGNLKKVIFEVTKDKKMFLDVLKWKPDVIIGLGQHPRSKVIRIERKTGKRFVSLKLKKDKQSRISYNAGTYICNYSMSVFSRVKGIKYAFLHIPKDMDVNKGVKYVEKILSKI